MTLKTRRRVWLAAIVLLLAAGAGGYGWLRALRLVRVEVAGAREAQPGELVRLTGATVGEKMLGIDPALAADRVLRHPWVATANATRLPTGVLRVEVTERVPVALAVDAAGAPLAYFDRAGYVLPVRGVAALDVPLVYGAALPINPTQPAPAPAVRALCEALAHLAPEADALVSAFTVRPNGEIVLATSPAPALGSLDVRLGRDGFGEKLERLARFWHQAVLTRPAQRYAFVDLRFDGQIVTREAGEGAPLPDTSRRPPKIQTARPDSTARGDSSQTSPTPTPP